jgi:2-polyprenyl-6-methoxyphenol hydroxylase-like FAD-dependent oxidoreductase
MDDHIDEIHPILERPDTASEHATADVVVVGARCAGAATAMLLARAGHDVVVVDRASSPSDTLSTHAIARGGVVQLQRWGLLDRVLASGAPALRRIEFHAVDEPIVRSVKDRHGVDLLIAPRRHVLDPILQDAAVEAGARLRTGFTVDDVLHDAEGRAVGVAGRHEGRPTEVRARFVVGADGLRSRVARSVGAPIIESHRSAGATHYRYYRRTWPAIEYHLGELGLAGVFPTHGGEGCVWVCTPDAVAIAERRRASSPDDALAAMIAAIAPRLARRLTDAVPTSPTRGMIGLPNQVLAPIGPGWALVGDAGYHRDAVTGHGITDAFRDAELLADALHRVLIGLDDEPEALGAYHDQRDRMLRHVFDLTCEMSTFPDRPRFVELQKQLAVAIDEHAEQLAGRPLPAAVAAA